MRDARGAVFMAGGGSGTGVFVFERCASGMVVSSIGYRRRAPFLKSMSKTCQEGLMRDPCCHLSTVTSNTSTLFGGMSPVRCAP